DRREDLVVRRWNARLSSVYRDERLIPVDGPCHDAPIPAAPGEQPLRISLKWRHGSLLTPDPRHYQGKKKSEPQGPRLCASQCDNLLHHVHPADRFGTAGRPSCNSRGDKQRPFRRPAQGPSACISAAGPVSPEGRLGGVIAPSI